MKLIETIEKCEFIVLEKYMKSEGKYKNELTEVLNNLRFIKYETGLQELDEMLEKENETHYKRKYEQENYFLEEYQVHLVNGDILTVYVKVKHGDNEKNHHQEALNIAKEQHPNLEILRVVYC